MTGGGAQDYHSGIWVAASLARKCTGIEVEEKDGSVKVVFSYRFSIHHELEVQIAYTVYPDGSIHVKSTYHGAAGLPQLPIFAVSFKVPADYDKLEWYALGPDENYIDRRAGARLGVFQNTVKGNMSGYLMPQESGNRTGVRRVDVTNSAGKGIRIAGRRGGEPLECNFSPFTALELENAKHHFELPNVYYTVVTVAGQQMGVGGDDSWGAPVHDEYLIQAADNLEFEYVISSV